MQIFEFATEAILDLFWGGKSSAILSTDFRLVLKSNYSFSACLAQIIPHQNQCGDLKKTKNFYCTGVGKWLQPSVQRTICPSLLQAKNNRHKSSRTA